LKSRLEEEEKCDKDEDEEAKEDELEPNKILFNEIVEFFFDNID